MDKYYTKIFVWSINISQNIFIEILLNQPSRKTELPITLLAVLLEENQLLFENATIFVDTYLIDYH